ncbi:MAG: RNA-binding S4 domain-containing protein [Myxococcota bacterium]|nr:RNA-binding S4 domain-containing protein [Myxococcota bacterium]
MSEEPSIQLDQFLKHQNLVGSGGEAKVLIQGGYISVNGEVETRRKRKLRNGDIVGHEDDSWTVDGLS